MANPSNSDVNQAAKDQQKAAGDTPDSSKDFARAAHDAREHAVGTEDEVRPAKGESKPTKSK